MSTTSQSSSQLARGLCELLQGEKESTRVWLRAELDRLVDPLVESVFDRLTNKLAMMTSADWDRIQSGDGDGAQVVDRIETANAQPQQPVSFVRQPSTPTSVLSTTFKPASIRLHLIGQVYPQILAQVKRDAMTLQNVQNNAPKANQQIVDCAKREIKENLIKRIKIAGSEHCSPSSSADESLEPVKSGTIESISDKELLSVYSRLPLCDLQSLERVSRRFRWIALKVYADRRSLSLIQAPQYRDQLEEITRYWYFTDYTTRHPFGQDCYRVTREVNLRGIRWLRARFPKVTQLTLYCVDHLSVERFVQLIQVYPTLERLVLFSTGSQQAEYNQTQFWTALYSLRASLRHLSLPFGVQWDRLCRLLLERLTPLFTPTLQALYINARLHNTQDYGEIPDYLDQFCWVGQDVLRCRYLSLLQLPPPAPADGPNQVAHNRSQVLTRLGMYVPECSSALSARLCAVVLRMAFTRPFRRMPRTHLDLSIPGNVSLLSILPELACLTRLTHIRLTERKTGLPPVSAFFAELNRQNYRTKLGQLNRTQLPSVRQLNLYQFDISPSTGIFLYLSIIFPHVTVLHLEDCPMSNSPGKHTFPGWFLNSLKRFAQLRQLYHNHRLVLELDRADEKRDELIQLIEEQMLDKDRI